MKIKNNRIYFPKFKEGMYFRGSEKKLSEIKDINQIFVTKEAGYYFCSITYEADNEFPEKKPLAAENSVGVDLGAGTTSRVGGPAKRSLTARGEEVTGSKSRTSVASARRVCQNASLNIRRMGLIKVGLLQPESTPAELLRACAGCPYRQMPLAESGSLGFS